MNSSLAEEAIAVLWLIAALVARLTDLPGWVFKVLLVKAGLDICCAIYEAIRLRFFP